MAGSGIHLLIYLVVFGFYLWGVIRLFAAGSVALGIIAIFIPIVAVAGFFVQRD